MFNKETKLKVSGVILAIIVVIFFFNRYPILQYTLHKLERINVKWVGITRNKVVALTFDDGPDPLYTPKILSILKRYKVPAAFFIEGLSAKKYPDLVRTEYNSGYDLGNHSFSHAHLARLSVYEINYELRLTDLMIQKATGTRPVFFRPPYLEISGDIFSASRYLHKKIVLSTITLEHASIKNPRNLVNRVVRKVFPGAIILMHDGRLNRHQTVKALPYLIESLTKKGYRIIPLRNLM